MHCAINRNAIPGVRFLQRRTQAADAGNSPRRLGERNGLVCGPGPLLYWQGLL
jgi:hypothetical protein